MGQLTLDQRYAIQQGIAEKLSHAAIGIRIKRNRTVVWRELKRNSDARNQEYKANLAHDKATKRHQTKVKKISFSAEIKNYVEKRIRQDYSPEQIVGRSKIEGIECVSIETIYQHVWADKKAGGNLHKHLRRKGKKYRKRGSSKDSRGILVGRVDISQRPSIVEAKKRLGDLEIDLVIGANHKQALLTINDRVSGMLLMGKVPSKEAVEIEKKTIELLADWKPFLHTMTSDNGKEFAHHENIANHLDLDFYFAKPYHSWQRGANENLNGLVRQYFPKKYDFFSITDEQILYVQKKLNNRPRKRFGYKTPNEVFANLIDMQYPVAFIT